MRFKKSILAVAVVPGLALATLGGAEYASSTDSSRNPDVVYKLVVREEGAPADQVLTEWIAPSARTWRMEFGAGKAKLFDGRTYAVIDPAWGNDLRTGSVGFIDRLTDLAYSRRPLEAWVAGDDAAARAGVTVGRSSAGRPELRFRRWDRSFVATIETEVSASQARELRLFEPPATGVTSRMVERRPGQGSTLAVDPYWFGPGITDLRAVSALDYRADLTEKLRALGVGPRYEARTHIVFYDSPAAAGRGGHAPEGKIQVVSQPIDMPVAQGAIESFNGRDGIEGEGPFPEWPRFGVTLANGETATVVPNPGGQVRDGFTVITPTTLVGVMGTFDVGEIAEIAAQLRPIA